MARRGVVHSEVFGGFNGAACGDRIADSGSHILVTMDGYYRNGELIDHKAKADQAVDDAAVPFRRAVAASVAVAACRHEPCIDRGSRAPTSSCGDRPRLRR